jgi:hypothetical protein
MISKLLHQKAENKNGMMAGMRHLNLIQKLKV